VRASAAPTCAHCRNEGDSACLIRSGQSRASGLRAQHIRTTEGLLEAAKTAKDRKILAEKLGVDEQTVLRWANLADRMRIKGVREPYAELLKDAGVDTVRELKYRNPGRLAEAMATANAKRKRVDLLPTAKRVEHWIADARKLTPKITY
jgi:predicted DCC family thiol-disulfide oxidoreductase YuxK